MVEYCRNCKWAVRGHIRWAQDFICCNHPNTHRGQKGMDNVGVNIKGNEHAIQKGWFDYPYNIDPIWINKCNGFERMEK